MNEYYTRAGLYNWEFDTATEMATVDWQNTLSNKWVTWRLNTLTKEWATVAGNHSKRLPASVITKVLS